MSEYQYYEFKAVDHGLTDSEMTKLRGFSSRARITPTSFVNEYSWGSFKGDEDVWMEKYFDAFLYLANWGTHRLDLRIPRGIVSIKEARLYCATDAISVREASGYMIFSFRSEEEGGDGWLEPEDELGKFLPIRTELVRGDLRCLYIAWLVSVQAGDVDEDVEEPPVPAGLDKLSPSLSSFVEFLRVDPDLVAVAAEASPRGALPRQSRKEMSDWVAKLPAAEKDSILIKLMQGEGVQIGMELISKFHRSQSTQKKTSKASRRTVAELLEAAELRANDDES